MLSAIQDMRLAIFKRNPIKRKDCLANRCKKDWKRGVVMNPSMQSLGYGLAALLFCVGIYFLCQEIKKLSYRFLHHRKSQSRDKKESGQNY